MMSHSMLYFKILGFDVAFQNVFDFLFHFEMLRLKVSLSISAIQTHSLFDSFQFIIYSSQLDWFTDAHCNRKSYRFNQFEM